MPMIPIFAKCGIDESKTHIFLGQFFIIIKA